MTVLWIRRGGGEFRVQVGPKMMRIYLCYTFTELHYLFKKGISDRVFRMEKGDAVNNLSV
jgi:hypothetical protein